MTQQITKYLACDGEEFLTLDDAKQHEQAVLESWLSRNRLGTFIDEADDYEESEYYETDHTRRLSVMLELYRYYKGQKCGAPDAFDTYIQFIKTATVGQINAIQQAIAERDS